MATKEAFLQAICEHPEEDDHRLIFADWLDERDDPLGEFIRVQLALEPLRIPRTDPREEFDRVRQLAKIPPGEDYERDDWPIAEVLDRESELLQEHEDEWLGPVASLKADHPSHFAPEFRRGLVASASIALSALPHHGEAIRQACPALQEWILFGTYAYGHELAACAAVQGVPRLTLAGWLSSDDAKALVESQYLEGLRSLTMWVGHNHTEELSVLFALSESLKLEQLTLVQLYGGIEAGEDAERLDSRTEELRTLIREQNVGWNVHIERPFARRFPLDGICIGHGIDAGYLPDGQAVLVWEDRQAYMHYFDDDGHFVREERLDLSDKLKKPPKYSWENCDVEELLEVLKQEIGFEPGPIFVHEFFGDESDIGLMCWDGNMYDEVMGPNPHNREEDEESAASLYGWYTTGQFDLPFGNDYWADGTGRIHTS